MQIITIQRVSIHKRPLDTVEIIKNVMKKHKIQFKWIGGGENNDINKYTPEIKSIGEWIPFVSEEKKWETLRKTNVFINTSELEGFNCGISEALSLGIPVLAYDIQEYHDVYKDNLIYAAKIGDIKSFTQALLDVIQHYEEYIDKYSQKSKYFINQNYSMEKTTDRIINVLEKIRKPIQHK